MAILLLIIQYFLRVCIALPSKKILDQTLIKNFNLILEIKTTMVKFWIIFGLLLYCELQEEHKRKPRQLKNCRLYEFFPNWIDCGFSYLRQWWLHRWQWPLLHIDAFGQDLFIRSEDLGSFIFLRKIRLKMYLVYQSVKSIRHILLKLEQYHLLFWNYQVTKLS